MVLSESKNPKKVLLVEPSASGHHMALYLRHVVRGLANEAIEVLLLTTKEAKADAAFQLVKTELPDNAKIFYFDLGPQTAGTKTIALLMNQVSSWLRLRKTAQKLVVTERPDVVYVPTVDWIAKAIELLGSPFGKCPFIALYMSPKHHRFATGIGAKSRSDILYDKLFVRLLRLPTLHKLLVIDEIFYEFARKRYGGYAHKIGFAPDFGSAAHNVEQSSARRNLGISHASKVLLVYGSLTLRKGIKELLEALAIEGTPKNLVLLLAGRPSANLEALLRKPEYLSLIQERRVVTRFKFHDADDESQVFSASDAVWVAYVNGFSGSSGVLHQSVGYGLPVIAGNSGLVGTLVQRFQLGATLDPTESSTVTLALKELAEGRMSLSASQEKVREFSHKYSSDSHIQAVLCALGDGNQQDAVSD